MDSIFNAPEECMGPEWIHKYFGECIKTDTQMVAFFIGLSSICFWLVAQAPQLYTNYQNGNADSLSALFLVQWLIGDSLNLIGSILSNQLATQIATAYYFVSIDIVMVGQFTYYMLKNAVKERQESKKQYALYSALTGVAFAGTLGAQVMMVGGANGAAATNGDMRFSTGRTLQSIDLGFKTSAEWVGYVLGIVSALFYLLSRIPQIVKNHKRKSTGGLSFWMFMLAVMGNVTYATSVLLNTHSWQFLLQKLPWLVGSLGTLSFDFMIAGQFVKYGDRQVPLVVLGAEEATPLMKEEGVLYVHGPPHPDETRYPISPLIYPAAQKPNYVIP